MSKRRVVVTGMGMLSPVGNTVESSWKALLEGQSGIVNIEHFDTTNFSTRFAGLVKDFDCTEYMSKKKMLVRWTFSSSTALQRVFKLLITLAYKLPKKMRLELVLLSAQALAVLTLSKLAIPH